jgi:hypothetical protein
VSGAWAMERCRSPIYARERIGAAPAVLVSWSPRTGGFGRRAWPAERRQGEERAAPKSQACLCGALGEVTGRGQNGTPWWW